MSKPLMANAKNDTFKGAPSFPLRHRLLRALWVLSWRLLASWTPAPLHRWRLAILRLAGAQVHPSAYVYGSVHIWYPANLTMDERSCLGPGVNCYNMGPIHLGKDATVSQGAHLCAGTHDIGDPYFQLIVKPIHIGDRAWVAAGAFVGPGVTVGEGAVLGARGCAFKDLDPWTVYAGNPAREIKKRSLSSESIK